MSCIQDLKVEFHIALAFVTPNFDPDLHKLMFSQPT